MRSPADGGGGHGGTNWSGMTMEQMWVTLENQDTTAHWSLISGWQKSYELTLQHLRQVQSFRENLATAWPPETSAASAAYLKRLDDLIKHLQNTYDAAVANHSAFSSATSALADSRRKLKVVYDAYMANKGKIDAYDERMAKGNPGGGRSVARFTAPPPITDQQQEQLTVQARSIMFGLSTEISQARASLTKPAKYDPKGFVTGGQERNGDTTYTSPVFPPLFPQEGESKTPQNTSHTWPPATDSKPIGNTPSQPGLVLGGTPPPPVISPGNAGIIPPSPGPPPPNNTINPPIEIPVPPTHTGPSSIPSRLPGPNTGGGLVKPGTGGTPTGGMRPMPPSGVIGGMPGGVIGGMPGAGLGQPGSARAAQRVNPVGGVLGLGNSSSRPSSPAGTSSRPGIPFVGVGGGASHRGNSKEATRWDPDNPWQTDEGVEPVVLPPSEQRFDPGPVIGFDR